MSGSSVPTQGIKKSAKEGCVTVNLSKDHFERLFGPSGAEDQIRKDLLGISDGAVHHSLYNGTEPPAETSRPGETDASFDKSHKLLRGENNTFRGFGLGASGEPFAVKRNELSSSDLNHKGEPPSKETESSLSSNELELSKYRQQYDDLREENIRRGCILANDEVAFQEAKAKVQEARARYKASSKELKRVYKELQLLEPDSRSL